jgi:hypothetical protein
VVYYAPRAFKNKHARWTAFPADLNIVPTPPLAAPAIRLTPDGWEADVDYSVPGSPPKKLKIRQDALIRPDK